MFDLPLVQKKISYQPTKWDVLPYVSLWIYILGVYQFFFCIKDMEVFVVV